MACSVKKLWQCLGCNNTRLYTSTMFFEPSLAILLDPAFNHVKLTWCSRGCCINTSVTHYFINYLSQRSFSSRYQNINAPKLLRECLTHTMCNVSTVTCHVLCVMGHVSHITCNMSRVMCHMSNVNLFRLTLSLHRSCH